MILVVHKYSRETITATALAAGGENNNIEFEYSAPFTNCMSEINNAQTDHAKDINIVT